MKTFTTASVDGADSAKVGYVYVLVTPARNEASFIEETIKAVIGQTVLPLKWVIVSDGSTDGTDDIVKRYAADHPWIELVRMPEHQERHFAAKVQAFNAGYALVQSLRYDAIACMDADVSFAPDYFAFLLARLSENPRLGLVGTPFVEEGESYDYRFVSIEHVSGVCQLFRRECFEAVGGYIPMEGGGVDHVAVITARMKGWQTRTFTEKFSLHQRKQGSAKYGALESKFRVGKLDYALGGHPLWEAFRVVYQMSKRPFILGGWMIFAGYYSSLIKRMKRPVSPELVRFRQREQMARLRSFFGRIALRSGAGSLQKSNQASKAEIRFP